jgi:HTH-type transcriptional regulator/antitoxin HigA
MNSKPRPYRPISPGEILKEELEARDWTQGDFAEIIGRPIQVVNEIITGKKAITPETAILFGEALGTSAELWLNLESSYRLDLLHQKQQKVDLVSRKAELYSRAPIKELIKLGWIQASESIDELKEEVLVFLGITDLNENSPLIAKFRRTFTGNFDSPSLEAWVRMAVIEANRKPCPAFNRRKLKRAIPDLISLSADETMTSQVPQKLCELGVRMVFVPHLPKTKVDGAAFWLDNNSPVIALSLRLNRVDNFWFTLMHEIAHILEGYQNKRAYMDTDLIKPRNSLVSDKPQDEDEKQANKMARDWLIPQEQFDAFVANTRPYFSRNVVLDFAEKLGIHPAIVVGRLQYEEKIPYTNLRNLLGKSREIFSGIHLKT